MGFKTLTWGVKASFRGYVEAMEGSVTLGDGATQTEDGAIVFTAVPGGDLAFDQDGSATGSMRFTGSVTFEAHGGMLKSTLTELGIENGEEGLVLTVQDAQMGQGRVAVAKLETVESDASEGLTLRSEITMDGMYQIADNYPPGTELDPVHLD